jgi:hypothetical protein
MNMLKNTFKHTITSFSSSNKKINLQKKHFSLYFPKKQLNFINHKTHGKVYPVYIADEEYVKQNNPNKLMPIIGLFSGFNLFLFFSSIKIMPFTILASIGANLYFLRKYANFLHNYQERVKAMYLLPSGNQIILEFFNGQINKLDNYDIYEYSLINNYSNLRKQNKKSIYINNENSFRCKINWGLGKESFIEGKRKYIDYEILSQIVSRQNIETQITKFKSMGPSIGIYTEEDKKKLLKFYSKVKRYSVERIDKNRLMYHFYKLRRRYNIDRRKLYQIKPGFQLY